MKRNNDKIEKPLSTVLTAAQMETCKAHVEEQRKKLRDRLLNR